MKGFIITKELSENQKLQVAELIYKTFPEKFSNYWIFEKNYIKGINVLKDCINYENGFYVIKNSSIIGIIGLSFYHNPYQRFDMKILRKYYGFIGSLWRNIINKLDNYITSLKPTDVYIEFLIVSSEYRSLGIGSLLIKHTMNYLKDYNYNNILLDVVDTNPRAQQLYSRLGFNTFKTINFRGITRFMGFRKDILMKKEIR